MIDLAGMPLHPNGKLAGHMPTIQATISWCTKYSRKVGVHSTNGRGRHRLCNCRYIVTAQQYAYCKHFCC